MSSIEKKWQIMPQIDSEFIQKYPSYGPLILQLLYNRGLKEQQDIDLFFNITDYEANWGPDLFNQMAEAIELIIKHIKAKNKITVHGDYDADGVTSSAVLFETLSQLKADVNVYIPDRVTEGYGLNKNAIAEIAKSGTKLIITVDGGIRDKDEVAYAQSLGMEVLITDHHVSPDELPPCLIVNPTVPGEKYPFKFLAGVGVAFKVAQSLIRKTKLDDDIKKALEERILDLVAIGTITDCVKIFGENRLLVKRGLAMMNRTNRLGLKELIKISQGPNGEGKKLEAWHIGFQIGPRLNAAGRMGHANTAFELLVTKDPQEAKDLAASLNLRNIERQKLTESITAEVDAQLVDKNDFILIGVYDAEVSADAWNEGVIGLVANRIMEKYYRPALVITKSGDTYKGSGRSIPEFNVIEAVSAAGEFLHKFGGHPAACGFNMAAENLPQFVAAVKKYAQEKLSALDLAPRLEIEAGIKFNEINRDIFDQIEKFSPFGEGNERPRFASFNVTVLDIMHMGLSNQHLKLKLKEVDSNIINAVGFGQSERWADLQTGSIIDIVYYIDLNEFNGRAEVQLKIIDIKLCSKN